MAGDVTRLPAQSVITRRIERSRRRVAFLTPKYDKVAKIFDRQYHSPSKVLKLEDDPWGSCAMYSPDKMKSGGGLMAPPGCFPGRYSPTYRGSDPRRCVPNPSVSDVIVHRSLSSAAHTALSIPHRAQHTDIDTRDTLPRKQSVLQDVNKSENIDIVAQPSHLK